MRCARRSSSSTPCRRSAPRSARPSSARGGRAHGRGGSHARRRGPGHGRRRPRQHRLAHPVGRRARDGARRRGDAARLRGRDRLRDRRHARAEGQGGAGRSSAGPSASSGVGGALKSAGLEPPFVGRDRELRLDQGALPRLRRGRRRTSSRSIGVAGIGKSRLAWEFEKYIDGLVDNVCWHAAAVWPTARASTYWALAEMVGCAPASPRTRSRARPPRSSAPTLERARARREERRFVEPRLAHLLGTRGARIARPEDLFAAWRLFFERLAEHVPDRPRLRGHAVGRRALLDFVEYLLEWSREHPLFILALARPELLESGRLGRRATQLHIARPRARSRSRHGPSCSTASSRAPETLREQILARAEGVPLYAVETVRMLLDRGLLVRKATCTARPARSSLEVPETLTRSSPRVSTGCPRGARLLQDAAVLGKTFTRRGSRRVSGLTESGARATARVARAQGDPRLQADPRRPSAASTASSRTSCARSPTRRSRRRSVGRATSPRPRTSKARSPMKTRSPRSSPRTTSMPTRHSPTRTTRQRSRRKRRRRSSGGRPRTVARSSRRGTALLRTGGRAHRRCIGAGRLSSIAPAGSGETRRVVHCRATARRGHRFARGRGRSPLGCSRVRRARGNRGGSGENGRCRRPRRGGIPNARGGRAESRSSPCWQAVSRGLLLIGELDEALPKADLAIELSESIGSPEDSPGPSLHGPRGCRNEAGAVDRTPQQSLAIAREHDLYESELLASSISPISSSGATATRTL